MKRTTGKLITMLLCLTLILSLLPVAALAAEETPEKVPTLEDITNKLPTLEDIGKLPELVATPVPEDPYGTFGTNFSWHLALSTGVLTIEGSGPMPDFYTESGDVLEAPWHAYRGKIKTVIMNDYITSIGKYAFNGLPAMTSITLPTVLTSVGMCAFADCTRLTSIELSEYTVEIGTMAFKGCTALTEIEIPKNTTKLGEKAFSQCLSLTKVVLPEGLTVIAPRTFENCAALEYINLPEGLTTISGNAFAKCSSLRSVIFPDSITTIEANAFVDSGLKYVSVPDSMKVIENNFNCPDLEAIFLPVTITEIADGSFSSCSKLANVYYGSGKLDWKKIRVGENNENLLNAAFAYNAEDLPEDIKPTPTPVPTPVATPSLKPEVVPTPTPVVTPSPTPEFVPDPSWRNGECGENAKWYFDEENGTLHVIGTGKLNSYGAATPPPWYAYGDPDFEFCHLITKAEFSEGITFLGAGFLWGCNLTEFTVPSTVTEIDCFFFEDCAQLATIYIPKSVKIISTFTFAGCGVKDIYYEGTEEEWNLIEIGEEGNGALADATIHFSSEMPSDPEPTPVIPDRNGDCGENVTWTFEGATGTLTVSGTGELPDYTTEESPAWFAYGDPNYDFSYHITNIVLEEGITTVGSYFFRGCNMKEITLPSTVTAINSFAFYDCEQLTHVTLPKSIKTIGMFAFDTAVETVTYEGTAADWEQIDIAAEGNEALLNAVITFSDGSTNQPTPTPPPVVTPTPTPTPVVPIEPSFNPERDPNSCVHTLYFITAGAPTCTEPGFTGKVICGKGCGTVLQEGKEKPALGHNYKKGTCSRCGHIEGTPEVTPPLIPAGDTPFVDMTTEDWFYEPVRWAVANKITSGTTENTFSPDGVCTRAQIVTFLWALADRPEPTSKSPFKDVLDGDWFFDPVIWAVEEDVTSGTAEDSFSPDVPCSRAQVAALLYKAMGSPEHFVEENPFVDVSSKDYYYDAVLWAYENGIASGVAEGIFGADQPCTRAQIATFLYKAYANK